MYLINQHTKAIMEECKLRARDAGLEFDNESLEYIVTNRDLLELSPKVMIPTLYDYWVNDVEVLKGKGIYKLYPQNPYETVINSRPAISFYNDNNPDWLNIMIFYHVLGHVDFFQKNIFFEKTWNDDFVGQALADKRLIEQLRSEYGRWVDYVLEFSRSIDNLVGFFGELSKGHFPHEKELEDKVKFYFTVFLQEINKISEIDLFKEIEKYNQLIIEQGKIGESSFFAEVKAKHPEFQAKYERYAGYDQQHKSDILEFIRDNSPFLQRGDNEWMKSILTIVRNTSLYFSPQIRTKIINEGWASYWHDTLFRSDERIRGHEVDYAVINAHVTSISRVGLNPYAIGLRLIQHVEKIANEGKIQREFQDIANLEQREVWNQSTGKGRDAIFQLRKNFSDFMLINTYVSQDFTNEHNLFVVGEKHDEERGVVQYYVKSRKADDYKQMLIQSLYHPPKVNVDYSKTDDKQLYLVHQFEGKPLYKEYVPEVLIGLEFLWGGEIAFETTEVTRKKPDTAEKPQYDIRRILYSVKNKKITKKYL
jgi:stage V sporulation protein R